MNRPRPHVPLDVAFLGQDTIRELGDRHGAAGPLVVIALVTEAHAAIPGKTKDFDVVEGRFTALARSAFIDSGTAQEILRSAVEVGLVEVVESDLIRFKVRLLKWSKWTAKDPTAASRKAKQRGRGSA